MQCKAGFWWSLARSGAPWYLGWLIWMDKNSTISTDRRYWSVFSLCHIWVNLLCQNSLFLVLSVNFPIIKSDAVYFIPVLFYIRFYILLHSIKLKSLLRVHEAIWWLSIHHTLYVHLSPEKGACSAAHDAAAHTTHPCHCWGVLWLAVTTAGQGPGNGCPFPTHCEEDSFCQHLNSSFPLNLRY